MKHQFYECPADCEGCQYCLGGLASCTVCKQAEAELEPECPGGLEQHVNSISVAAMLRSGPLYFQRSFQPGHTPKARLANSARSGFLVARDPALLKPVYFGFDPAQPGSDRTVNLGELDDDPLSFDEPYEP